ncbi:MAG: amidohydrolase family protein [Acidimicrobiaceae bacterium]|nr:amidohydrolase family protein [Acidimicrobiaceae bacterium]
MTRILSNALLADGRLVDVHIEDGLIAKVAAATINHPEGAEVQDLGGWLLVPAMAEPHAHLDKALTAEDVPNPKGDLRGAIDGWIAAAASGMFTHENTVERAASAMELLLVHGVTAVRTHINVLDTNRTKSLRAVKEAARRFDGLLDVQTVALTSSPMTGPAGAANRSALEAAVEEGVDFIGGCPHLDPDGPGLIRNALKVATDAGIGVDLHVDEMLDPSVLTLRELARQVIDSGFSGSVAAGHCVTLGMQPRSVQLEVSRLVAEAGIAVFPLPQTNLFLQGRDDLTAMPRGLTAVAALQECGVLVAAGADNVQDPFNLVGRSDPLETAALMVMAGHQLPDTAYDMVSNNVRRAIGLPEVHIEPGDPADLVAIDAPSIRGAIADAPMSRRVFRRGVLVASADQQSTIHHVATDGR